MEDWEHTIFVPMKFNRRVLFHTWMWHAGGKDSSDSLDNDRFVQLFFWQAPQKATPQPR
uniref:Phytanoyl-CoA dioxygenase n=1 Tax=uncultured alpha proteobacterium EF100_94H03 TaxID=710800 RepID=E0Y205_9PROT|nr:hypothetical protein [uncultured alpha proteobacterium EF100_94H03]